MCWHVLRKGDLPFFAWDEGTKTCELGYMDQGWHFNYTDDPLTRKQVSVNIGM